MQQNYILIDYENVQPKNLELLDKHPFKIYVFIGSNQSKLSRQLAVAMQKMGEKAQYVEITGNGPNALDFHIAFYIGELAEKDPKADFHIISKDKGFDPLITHLKNRKIAVSRSNDLAEIPILRVAASSTPDEKISTIVKNLRGRGQSKPRRVKTLQNTINSLFTSKLDNGELQSILKQLQDRKFIVVKDGKVTYNLQRDF